MIGIFGGTFDPIHHGHLRVALDAREALELEQVRFIPLGQAVHRHPPQADAEQRLAMVRAAVEGQPGFVADDREIRREGPSYSLLTLQSLRGELPREPLCLLMGGDAFNGYLSWHEPLQILELAHLVIMQRPGAAPPEGPALQQLVDEHRAASPADLRTAPAGRILFQTVTQLDIAASDIRARIAAGRSPRYLLPEAVLEHIEKQSLYR